MSETATELMATELSLVEESAQAPGSMRVDRENHVIFGVKLLGATSKNLHPVSGKPYRYTDNALNGFAKLQEGARVYIDHQKKGDQNPRSYGTQLGDFRAVRCDLASESKGTFGDLHYNPKHPLIEQVLFDAENAPHRLAMSHVAVGAGRADKSHHLVEEAKSVASVDLVCRGATNVSLFEAAPAAPTIQPPKEDNTMEIAKLQEENKALTDRIALMEAEAETAKRRVAREAALKVAGVTASESLMEHLVTCDDAAAVVVIEALKGTNTVKPTSRDPNIVVDPIKGCDDFLTRLGG